MKPVTKSKGTKVPLERWDPSGETYVMIHVADHGAMGQRAEHFSRVVYEQAPDGTGIVSIRAIQDWSPAELVDKELWLTFGGSNLQQVLEEKEDGELVLGNLFPEHKLNFEAFRRIISELDSDLVDEWHVAVLRLNPKWRQA